MGDDFRFHESKHKETFEKIKVMTLLEAGTFESCGHQITVKEPLQISVHKDDSDRVDVYAHMEEATFVVEVQKNEQTMVYEYPATRADTSG